MLYEFAVPLKELSFDCLTKVWYLLERSPCFLLQIVSRACCFSCGQEPTCWRLRRMSPQPRDCESKRAGPLKQPVGWSCQATSSVCCFPWSGLGLCFCHGRPASQFSFRSVEHGALGARSVVQRPLYLTLLLERMGSAPGVGSVFVDGGGTRCSGRSRRFEMAENVNV